MYVLLEVILLGTCLLGGMRILANDGFTEVILLGTCLLGGVRILANDGFTDCPDGFDYIDKVNLCYKVLFEDLDWDHATVKCHSLSPGGRLAVILTQVQQNIVANFLRDRIEEKPEGVTCKPKDDKDGGLHFWIAGRAKTYNAPFFWRFYDDLEFPFRYTSWNPGSPVKDTEHWCAMVNSSMEYNWNNAHCGLPRCAICEI